MLLVNVDLAGVVLDKCTTTCEVEENGIPTATQIEYNYEFIDDFDVGKLSTLGNFLLNKVLRYKSQCQDRDIQLTVINHQAENGDTTLSSTSSPEPVVQHNEQCTSVENWGPKVYDNENHTMSLMVRVHI